PSSGPPCDSPTRASSPGACLTDESGRLKGRRRPNRESEMEIEVLVQTPQGWFPPQDRTPFDNLLKQYTGDLEIRRHGKWQRAALVSIYSRHPQLRNDSSCHFSVEGQGGGWLTWRQFRNNVRPYNPPALDLPPGKELWDRLLDDDPL